MPKVLITAFLLTACLGCASTGRKNAIPAFHGSIDAAHKTILIPFGSSDLIGRVKDLFRDECWSVNVVDTPDAPTAGTKGTDDTDNQPRYRLDVGATLIASQSGAMLFPRVGYDYNLSLTDTKSGEELLNLYGYGSSKKIVARIKKALENADNGTCPELTK